MPFGKWKNFEDCVKDFTSQGKDEESARRICGALKARLGEESFTWDGDIKPHKGNLIHGRAIHPVKTLHPEEWPEVRVYLEGELKKAAHTLVGSPILLDHMYILDGKILSGEYEDGAVEYVAELKDERVLEWIKDGTIRHCSVEYDWGSLEKVDGVAPRGIRFTGLSLLKDFEPGDPQTTVEVWESLIKSLKEAKSRLKEQAKSEEFIFHQIRDPRAFLEDRFSTAWIDKTNGIQGLYGLLREDPENPQLMALLFMRIQGWNLEKAQSWIKDHPEYVGASTPGTEQFTGGIQTVQRGLMAEKASGEAVIDPEAWTPEDAIDVKAIIAELKEACYERVPRHWSYGAYLQNLRLKNLIKRLERASRIERTQM